MFVCSIRSTTLKFIAAIALSLTVLFVLVALIPTAGAAEVEAAAIRYDGVGENADRISFISQFGWQVDETPVETAQVTVPQEFDTVYLGYNELQKEQGLNLKKYQGKEVTRYTYQIKNYPDYEGTVYISLLVYRDHVIGGDVCSADVNGFVHGFAAPDTEA